MNGETTTNSAPSVTKDRQNRPGRQASTQGSSTRALRRRGGVWSHRLRTTALGSSASAVLALLGRTFRWHLIGVDRIEGHLTQGTPFLAATWHGHQLCFPVAYQAWMSGLTESMRRDTYVLTSRHGDGRIAAKAVAWFGLKTVDGSSTRGGAEALRALLRLLRDGANVALTVDGPRGPLHEVKPGIVKLASRSGLPIFPLAVASSSAWTFRSWDQMFLPKPFAKVVLAAGPPVVVPPAIEEEDLHRYQRIVKEAIEAVAREAQGHCAEKRSPRRGTQADQSN